MACQNQIQTLEESQVSFPTEIVVEILLRLTDTSLLRCRSVCKLWYSLISDPYFINSKYLSSSTRNNIDQHRLIFSNKWRSNISICNLHDALYDKSVSNKVVTIDKPLEHSIDCAVIASSCNGFVCFFDENNNKHMFIWNPNTGTCKRLSPCYGFWGTYGLGYDESTDDYKFFAICKSKDRRMRKYSMETRICSLKTGMWNAVGDFPYSESTCHGDGKYLNGALHWRFRRTYYGDNPGTIVSFHLATETYGQVLQPNYDDEDTFDMSLGALGEQLCILCYSSERRSDIWVMKVYGVKESWTKLFSIPYMPDRENIPSYHTPLFISNDGKILFQDWRKLFVYDSKNGSYSKIKNFKVYGKACTFVESFDSPMPTPCLDNNSDNTFVENLVSSLDNNSDDPWALLTPVWHSNLFD